MNSPTTFLPEGMSRIEFEDQLRHLNRVLWPVSPTEGAQERRNAQAIWLIERVKKDWVRVESIHGKSVVFGRNNSTIAACIDKNK